MKEELARQIRQVHFGPNWTSVSLKESLADISWEQAITKVYSFNTIAALVYHMNYYVSTVLKVLNDGPLDAHDKYSFDHPEIRTQQDWEKLIDKVWNDAEELATIVEQLPEHKLQDDFADGRYGTIYRNISASIEHFHYHLGQISLIKKILSKKQ